MSAANLIKTLLPAQATRIHHFFLVWGMVPIPHQKNNEVEFRQKVHSGYQM